MIGYVEIVASSDKRFSRVSKFRGTFTTGTRSRASFGGTSQQLTKQVSTQDITGTNTLTT